MSRGRPASLTTGASAGEGRIGCAVDGVRGDWRMSKWRGSTLDASGNRAAANQRHHAKTRARFGGPAQRRRARGAMPVGQPAPGRAPHACRIRAANTTHLAWLAIGSVGVRVSGCWGSVSVMGLGAKNTWGWRTTGGREAAAAAGRRRRRRAQRGQPAPPASAAGELAGRIQVPGRALPPPFARVQARTSRHRNGGC
jgi:hypothetical protein